MRIHPLQGSGALLATYKPSGFVGQPAANALAQEPFGPRHRPEGENRLFVELSLSVQTVGQRDAVRRPPGMLVEEAKVAEQFVHGAAAIGIPRPPKRRVGGVDQPLGDAACRHFARRQAVPKDHQSGHSPAYSAASGPISSSKPLHGRRGGCEPQRGFQVQSPPGGDEIGQGQERRIVVHPPLVGDRQQQRGMTISFRFQSAKPAEQVAMRLPHRGFVAGKEIARSRRPIAGLAGVRGGPAAPFHGIKEEVAGGITVAQVDEDPPSVGHFPPNGRRTPQGRQESRVVHARQQPVNAAIQQCDRAGAGNAVDIVLHGDARMDPLPKVLRQPVQHFLPLPPVQGGRVVHGHRRNGDLARVDRFQEIRSAFGRRRAPPVVDADRAFRGPAEPRPLGPILRRQGRVDGDVQVANLQLPANNRMIGVANIRMGKMDQIDVLNGRGADLLGRDGSVSGERTPCRVKRIVQPTKSAREQKRPHERTVIRRPSTLSECMVFLVGLSSTPRASFCGGTLSVVTG